MPSSLSASILLGCFLPSQSPKVSRGEENSNQKIKPKKPKSESSKSSKAPIIVSYFPVSSNFSRL
ncbi:uncharacterized protein LOC120086791 [Benincasa hispida]|uniref:uncharacterized protein LOC120086791 n=1 Tax=Benincasa hispida TaxID=102211 RepID=UPI001902B1B8|nr:uncharacterized protein LOC120086791 [Benincasa hispida]